MGRSPRIEYEGAVYHIMSRGNRGITVFRDGRDCGLFIDTLDEACGRTGWHIHAFALMGTHYHLLLETPEPNLVDGMRWLQGTFTKRINSRHNERGHLLQGRYKALLVDGTDNYFSTVCTYIHLNPARARCFDLKNGRLSDYRWSSYPLYLHPSRRPDWLHVERMLGCMGMTDNAAGRIHYREYMKQRVLEINLSDKPWLADQAWASIRQGWCFGDDAFRRQMQEKLEAAVKGKRRSSYSGCAMPEHDIAAADRLLCHALEQMGLNRQELSCLPKGDWRKKVIAWMIRKRTTVRNEWIAGTLCMGSPARLSMYVKEIEISADLHIRKWKKMLIC